MGPLVFVRGRNHTVAASYTRPSDTSVYAAGDVLNNSTSAPTILTFSGIAVDRGGGGIIQSLTCISSASQATKPDLELWLFDTAMVMDNDNAVFTPTDAELLTLVGVIAIPSTSFKVGDATAGAGGNSICNVQNIGLPFNTLGATGAAGATPGVNDLYGVLVVRNAYTPVSAEVITIRIQVCD